MKNTEKVMKLVNITKQKKKGRKEMTDEEKVEEYAKEQIKDMKVGNFNLLEIAHLSNGADIYNPKVEHLLKDRIKKAYLDGLADGRKETAEKISEVEKENAELKTKYESYLRSHTITCAMTGEEIIEMRKENEELKAQIEKLECCETEIQVKAKNRFLENLKLISPDIYKKYCETDFVELRRCQNRLNQSKE